MNKQKKYLNGILKPSHSDNYFKWSNMGAKTRLAEQIKKRDPTI